MTLALLVAIALLASGLGTWRVLRLAHQRQLLAIPNERSSHSLPTPTGGGLGVCLAFACALPVSLLGEHALQVALTTAAVLLAGWVGWRDDAKPLAARVKFGVLLVAAGMLLPLARLERVELPYLGTLELGVLAIPLSLFWLTGFTNAFNFMDGINGIAASTAAISGTAFAKAGLEHGDPLLVAAGATTAAAALGFLPWNFPKARIFMGDAGSLSLGLGLSFCALQANASGALPFAAGVLVLGPFVFDSTFTVLARALRGERVWRAHREHLYQRLSRRLGSHVPVTALYAVLSLTLSGLALTYSTTAEHHQAWVLGGALGFMVAFAAVVLRLEGRGEEPVQVSETGTRAL